MNERGVEYHLVERQPQLHRKSCELHRITCRYVCRFTFQVLARRRSADGRIERLAPVSGIDFQRLAPRVAQRLQDILRQCLDAVADLERSDDIADALCVCDLTPLELPITEVFAYRSHLILL